MSVRSLHSFHFLISTIAFFSCSCFLRSYLMTVSFLSSTVHLYPLSNLNWPDTSLCYGLGFLCALTISMYLSNDIFRCFLPSFAQPALLSANMDFIAYYLKYNVVVSVCIYFTFNLVIIHVHVNVSDSRQPLETGVSEHQVSSCCTAAVRSKCRLMWKGSTALWLNITGTLTTEAVHQHEHIQHCLKLMIHLVLQSFV